MMPLILPQKKTLTETFLTLHLKQKTQNVQIEKNVQMRIKLFCNFYKTNTFDAKYKNCNQSLMNRTALGEGCCVLIGRLKQWIIFRRRWGVARKSLGFQVSCSLTGPSGPGLRGLCVEAGIVFRTFHLFLFYL